MEFEFLPPHRFESLRKSENLMRLEGDVVWESSLTAEQGSGEDLLTQRASRVVGPAGSLAERLGGSVIVWWHSSVMLCVYY